MSLLWFEHEAPSSRDLERLSAGMRDAAGDLHLDLQELAFVSGLAHREQVENGRQVVAALGLVGDSVGYLTEVTSELLAIAGAELPVIRSLLTGSLQSQQSADAHLAAIEKRLGTPAATAGHELRQRGLYALRQQWHAEAVKDLTAAVEVSPYDPLAWWGLGAALEEQGSSIEAGRAHGRGARYAVPINEACAAALALLSIAQLERGGEPAEALEVCMEILGALTRPCAPMLLVSARLSGHLLPLAEALELNPALVVEASYAGMAVEDAAELALRHYLESTARLRPALGDALTCLGRIEDPHIAVPPKRTRSTQAAALVHKAAELEELRVAANEILRKLETTVAAKPDEIAPLHMPDMTEPKKPARGRRPLFGPSSEQRMAMNDYEERMENFEFMKLQWQERAARHKRESARPAARPRPVRRLRTHHPPAPRRSGKGGWQSPTNPVPRLLTGSRLPQLTSDESGSQQQ